MMSSTNQISKKIATLSQQKNWPSFVYVGDCCVDSVNQQPKPGGCAMNVSYHLHSLGNKADVVTWIGNDEESKTPKTVLLGIGADEQGVHQLTGKTPIQHITVQANGEKKFEKYEVGVLGNVHVQDSDVTFINQHQILITLYYSQIANLFDQVTKINFNGLKVIDFMNMADFNFDVSFVKKYSDWFDIGMFGLNADQIGLIDQIKTIAEEYEKLCIVTLGEAGSKIFWHKEEYYLPTQATKIVDTTGCGDAFLAGFLSEFVKDQNIQQAMKTASHMAAKVSTHEGALPI